MNNTLKLKDLFTTKEIKEFIYIYQLNKSNPIEHLENFLAPLMPKINEITGQENSIKYFAYFLQYTAMKFDN